LPKNLSDEKLRLRIQRISEVLRQFGLVDKFNLDDLFRREKLPSVSTLTRKLGVKKVLLPPSITPEFMAKSIVASLNQKDPDTTAWGEAYKTLRCKIDKIPTGNKNASRYHHHIFELLRAIFEGILENPEIEQEVDTGLGFIDIVFDNMASEGFFTQLSQKYGIPCKYISFECKNYKSDIGNTEYNQLSSRLNDKRGIVGFLVCRLISDQKKAKQQCKHRFENKKEYILILEDCDIKVLFQSRQKGDLKGLNRILLDKFRQLYM
jgi:hypothetical protein